MKKKVWLLLLLCIFPTSLALAARLDIHIQARGFTKLKVAMPYYTGPADLTSGIWSMCAKDLAISGVFEVLSPQSYINPGPVSTIAQGTLKDWALIGADYIITGNVSRRSDMVTLDVQVIEVASAKFIDRKTYSTSAQTIHTAVHAFMDTFLDKSLGLKEMFSSKIIAVRRQNSKKQICSFWCDATGWREIKGLGDLVLNPAWSKDAKKVAFVSYWRDNPDLYLLDLVTNKVELLSGRKGINSTPAFHPSGSMMACTLSINGNPEIYFLDLASKKIQQITRSWATDTSPSFSPDGKYMAFCSDRCGTPQIYLMDLKERKVQRLTFEGRYNTEPVFSPRGDMIAFSHSANGIHQIALILTDGSQMTVLPGTGKGDESPTFSPDGRLIAFASSDGNIYVTDLVGSKPVRITNGEGVYSEPSWSLITK